VSSAGRLIVAYHGCDVATRDALVSGQTNLKTSSNPYDWLGDGAYFFEDDPHRALHFAQSAAAQPQKRYTSKPIQTPAVVGAVLRINHWLDLATQEGIQEFGTAYEGMRDYLLAKNKRVPVNKAAGADDDEMILHNLDRAVINHLHAARALQKLPAYQAVRGPFTQGQPVINTSAIRARTHVQLALRELGCVVGYFLPRGL